MNRFGARTVYFALEGATSLFFSMIFAGMIVYRIQVIGLDPFQLVFLGTVLEITAFLSEIPTGIVADTRSRRLSVIVGIFLLGAGFTVEGLLPFFAVSLLGQVITGIGYAFTSGAAEAWITDEIGEEDANRAFMRAAQIGQIGSIIGILSGALLASISLNLPVLLGGGATLALGVFLIVAMAETNFKPTRREGETSLQAMRSTFKVGVKFVRTSRILVIILIIAAIFGAYSEGFDRLWQAHFLKNFTFPTLDGLQPVVWFGIIGIVIQLLSLVGTEITRRRVNTNSHVAVARSLMALNALLTISMIVFGLAGNFYVAVLAYGAASLLRNTTGPLNMAWLNQNLDPQVRATIFSMRNQADAFGQIIGGPVVGWVATAFSLRAVMVIAGLMLTPALWLYRHSMRPDPGVVVAPEEQPVPIV